MNLAGPREGFPRKRCFSRRMSGNSPATGAGGASWGRLPGEGPQERRLQLLTVVEMAGRSGLWHLLIELFF